MIELPNELVHHIFMHLPLYHLKTKMKFLCKAYNIIAVDVIEKRLKSCFRLLQDLGPAAKTPAIQSNGLNNLPDLILDGRIESPTAANYVSLPHSDMYTLTPFKAWMLCNLEYPSDSNVLTGIEIVLTGNLSVWALNNNVVQEWMLPRAD